MPAPFDSKSFVDSLPGRPGVYRMYDAGAQIIYVGKARNLKNRVGSYFHRGNVEPKVQALVRQITHIEVTLTHSETEALLLEANLIREHKPRYNVLLKDDKSFPFLRVTTQAEFPRITYYRGSRKEPGRYFGPYPNAWAAREAMQQLQKLFRLRNCEDSYFAHRNRPCLQYQIKRCTAPCVGYISVERYAQDVRAALKVLDGRSEEVNRDLAQAMDHAAEQLDFEAAARFRDQIAYLKEVQSQQSITADPKYEADVIAVACGAGEFCVAALFVRAGRSLGSTAYFPKAPLADRVEVLEQFLAQYYLEREPPAEIIIDEAIESASALEESLTTRSGHSVRVAHAVRGVRARWLAMTRTNAEAALKMRGVARADTETQLEALRASLDLDITPQRIECFDISHTGGTETVASCVVFGPDGALKKDYRRFNIQGIEPGDDYAAIHQALARRYKRVKDGEIPAPDVLLIDGGKGQLAAASAALAELGVANLTVIGVAKGTDRRAGQERLFLLGQQTPYILPPDSPALHLIQRVRDEAHRFAITGHRRKRAKRHSESVLEAIPGLGPARRRELLKHFGGLQGVLRAGLEDLSAVRGLGQEIARSIYEYLHPGS
jgi:excinuclease ABC subunit C